MSNQTKSEFFGKLVLCRQEVCHVNVPQQPSDPDDAVLLGADPNGNGIRDKVERVVAAQYGVQNHAELMVVAAEYQRFLSVSADNPAALQTQSAMLITDCLHLHLSAYPPCVRLRRS